MSCTNCFSGCVSTTSDKCVKYTGNSITSPIVITTGDTLESVEKKITDYLLLVFTGEGIFPTITPSYICDVVQQYFPCAECGDPSLVDILTAIIRAICDIEAEIVAANARIDVIEADYDSDCLKSDGKSGTHEILQEVITSLCTAIGDIATLNNLFKTCITTGAQNNINDYIQAYINSINTTNLMYTKMVPYVVYPFYPTAAIMGAFSYSGVGSGDWANIYLCNGNNTTPDLRGRSLIGTINGMGGDVLTKEVDPGLNAFSKSYVLGDMNGENSVTLTTAQLSSHTHAAVTTIDEHGGHTTPINVALSADTEWDNQSTGSGCPVNKIETLSGQGVNQDVEIVETYPKLTGITASTVNAVNEGGEAHLNVHPVFAVHYIIYLPTV